MSPLAEASVVDVRAVPEEGTSVSRVPTRLARCAAALLCALVSALALSVPAFAGDTHLFEGSFDGSATPAGSFNFPGRMAIDESADVLYVIDAFNGAVVKLDISGSPESPTPADFSALGSPALDGAGAGEADETPQGSLNLSPDADIAVDNSGGATDGNVYVASESGFLYAFGATGAFLYALDGSDPDGSDPLEGTPTSSLDSPCGVAVGSDGSIYVSGYFAAAVRKFTPAGGSASYASEISTEASACHIAVDSTGSLYVNHYGSDVERYDASGSSLGVIDPGPANAVAVAPDDHVYVDRGDRIVEYDPTGAQISEFGAGRLGGSLGVAVGGSANSVFASDTSTNAIHVFGPLTFVDPPTVEVDPPADPAATSADLTGRVNPQGFETAAHFEYSLDGGAWAPLATHDSSTDPDLANSTSDVELTDQATGLQPNRDYQVRLVASNPGGETISTPADFHTDAQAPVAVTRPHAPDHVTTDGATIYGEVDARNSATTYYFDYSTDPALPPGQTASVPVSQDGDAGAGGETKVSERLEGLAADTTYYYRLTASNATGTDVGEIHSLTTKTAAAATGPCSNAQYRVGASAGLPDCRAYEQVSPVDKNGVGVREWGTTTYAAPRGNAVAYASFGGFADGKGTGNVGQAQYVAYRQADGWITRAVTPTPAADSNQLLVLQTVVLPFSDDLRQAVVLGYDLDPTDDAAQAGNLYRLDIFSGGLETITTPLAGPPPSPLINANVAAPPDLGSVIFDTTRQLLPEAPPTGRKLYLWRDGQLTLGGVLPDGTVPESSSTAGLPDGQYQADTISADGSRFAFVAPASGPERQLYLRKGSSTVRVSRSEASDPVDVPADVRFLGGSPDERVIVFASSSRLTDSDPGGEGTALYRYRDSDDPDNDANLTFLVRGDVQGILGMSDDGDSVYYRTSSDINLWRDGGVLTVVKGTDNVAAALFSNRPTANTPKMSRVSPDGRYLAFVDDNQSGIVHAGASVGHACQRGGSPTANDFCSALYVYDAATDSLECASCPDDRAVSSLVEIAPMDWPLQGAAGGNMLLPPRFLSNDGEVFFSTADALVARDTNGRRDVYRYDIANRDVALLTTGRSADDSWFADASPDGEDVFVVTRERLVGWDADPVADLYDVRVGGGLAEPGNAQPDCAGDECQGAAEAAPPPKAPGSSGLDMPSGPTTSRRTLRIARLTVGQRRALARRGRAVLRITTGQAGRIVVRSPRLRRVVRSTRGGSVRVTLRLTRPARARLRTAGRLRVPIAIRIGETTRTMTLVLRRGK